MKALLGKHWFLAVLLGGVALAWFEPQWLRPATQRLEPRAVVALALFLMAWTLESRSLFTVLARPLPALWAAIISYGPLPALGLCAGWLLPDADLRIGLLLITAVPCTLASAVLWTRLAGGSEATALLVILLTTATSWLVTTAWLAFATGTAAALDAATLMRSLVLVLVLPVGIGQIARSRPRLRAPADRLKPAFSVVSRLLILCIILKAAVDVSDRLSAGSVPLSLGALAFTAVLCAAIHLVALVTGLVSSRLLRFDYPTQIAVAFSCSQKTLPVALYVFDAYFLNSYPLAIVPPVFYHVGQLLMDTLIAERLAHGHHTNPTR